MIKVTLKHWRAAGLAATLSLAACGGEAGSGGEAGGDGGEAGEGGATAPAPPAPAAAAGGEAGEAGAASAYAGVTGDQLTALRLQHLKGFLMAANRVSEANMPAEAGVLVAQGVLEVYDAAPDQFGGLNIEIIRAATDSSLNRAQMTSRIRAAEAEIERVSQALDVDHAALVGRMVDIATGLYQHVNQTDFVDPVEYQHSMGAALAARDALIEGQDELRREDLGAFSQSQAELNRFVGLWDEATAPEEPATYQQVLSQGSRVRLELSPFL